MIVTGPLGRTVVNEVGLVQIFSCNNNGQIRDHPYCTSLNHWV